MGEVLAPKFLGVPELSVSWLLPMNFSLIRIFRGGYLEMREILEMWTSEHLGVGIVPN